MAFSPLALVNALVPKDLSSRRIAQDVPYGPEPRQKLDIYAPRQSSRRLPVIFFVYGGSWSDGDRRWYEFAGRSLAALGYITVIADYRLVPVVEYPDFLEDAAAAFAWVTEHIAQYGGDPHSIALMGHSAGAYNALMLAMHPSYLRHKNLLTNVRCMVGLSGPYDFFPLDGRISLRVFGAIDNPRDSQPINHVAADLPPALFLHGEKDTLVYTRNSIALAAKLRDSGVPAEVKLYPGLDHPGPLLALMLPARPFTSVRKDIAAFLRQHL